MASLEERVHELERKVSINLKKKTHNVILLLLIIAVMALYIYGDFPLLTKVAIGFVGIISCLIVSGVGLLTYTIS